MASTGFHTYLNTPNIRTFILWIHPVFFWHFNGRTFWQEESVDSEAEDVCLFVCLWRTPAQDRSVLEVAAAAGGGAAADSWSRREGKRSDCVTCLQAVTTPAHLPGVPDSRCIHLSCALDNGQKAERNARNGQFVNGDGGRQVRWRAASKRLVANLTVVSGNGRYLLGKESL